MRIIVDAMGGDNAPFEIIKGTYEASQEYNASFILVGDKNIIEKTAAENRFDLRRFEIVDTKTVITMEDNPLCVVRSKQDSSMSVGFRMLRDGQGDAFVSAGNTGALFTGASLIVRKIKGVQRAAIASVLPFKNPVLLLDSGANLTVTDECLEQFAAMGSAYMRNIYKLDSPRVGLLNNGIEECKGTQLQLDAYKRMSEATEINFVGNVEANKITANVCDVLVCDGFTGNILLKSIEGMGRLMIDALKEIFMSNYAAKMSAALVQKPLRQLKKDFDSTEHGGAPILGIAKPVIKAHGSSNAKAFKNAIRQTISFVDTGVIYDIAREAEEFQKRHKSKHD